MKDLHIEEFKVRLRDEDADLVRALARKTQVPAAVLLRQFVLRELERLSCSVPKENENRRPA